MFSLVIAIVVAIVWATIVGYFVHDLTIVITGKIARRPKVWESIISMNFFVLWDLPMMIFLGIWGGIFWW